MIFLFSQLHEWYQSGEKIKSKMEIDPATQMDAGIYECYADNKYAVDKRTFRTDFITNFDWKCLEFFCHAIMHTKSRSKCSVT